MRSFRIIVLFVFCSSFCMIGQSPRPDVAFDFNQTFNERNGRLVTKPVGVTLGTDRFGNPESALYLHGNPSSYLNLGTDSILKPVVGSISLWVNFERKVYAGKGYESNPVLVTKNSYFEDFYDAYSLFLDMKSERLMVASSSDTLGLKQASVSSTDMMTDNKWYHVVFSYNDDFLDFYIDGKLQQRSRKGFRTKFQSRDSVMVGNGASTKNDRWMRGTVDDIRFFHRVLSEQEILALYNEPNPDKNRELWNKIKTICLFACIIIVVALVVVWRYRVLIRRQKEQYELKNRVNELEMQVIKAQLNPHFISNCLAAIQDLIYKNDIEKAGQYIAKFSFFLRQILYFSDKTFVMLHEELEVIRLNVELEQLRFNEDFEFRIGVAGNIKHDEIQVPALITQPFIENAIWHGLLPLKEGPRKPKLNINVYKEQDHVFIEIEDNGVGRKPYEREPGRIPKGTRLVLDKIDSINKLLKTDSCRIRVIDLFDIENKPCGTKVLIQLINYSY